MAAMTRVLYVDDDEMMRELFKASMARSPDFAVAIAPCGEDALIAAADATFDLILLDVSMPGMDGPTVLQHLRSNSSTCDIPIVFITARTQPDQVEKLLASGAVGVIAKPFKPRELADRLGQILEAL
jgi:two-component system, OmpR family, response regulator